MLKVGDKAPDFVSQDHTGKRISLADLRGKTVVLWFYPKADTPGCTAEGCGFRDLSNDYNRKNVVILGVSVDGAVANSAFATKYGFEFPLLCDVDRSVSVAYGACDDAAAVKAKRIGVVIDASGIIKAYYPTVDAQSFPAQVIETL